MFRQLRLAKMSTKSASATSVCLPNWLGGSRLYLVACAVQHGLVSHHQHSNLTPRFSLCMNQGKPWETRSI